MWWTYQTHVRMAKQIANAGNPRIVSSSSSYVVGTSAETTISVNANPKTMSLNASTRDTSCPRTRNGIALRMREIVRNSRTAVS